MNYFMKYSFKIGSVWGIPIELHITFILLMILELVLSWPTLYLFALVMLLFVFVTFHELSHSVVAKRYNIKVRKIVLYPIGGVSEIEEIPEKPSIEWRMAISGPLMSFVIGFVLLGLGQLFTIEMPTLALLFPTDNMILELAQLNILLGAFNLVPAFPMDGGRVFRALLAERMKFTDATRYAAFLGKLLGVFMAVFGVLYNFWLIIVGVFVYIGATEEAESTIISTTLARVRVKDVMQPEAAVAAPETTLNDAMEVMLKMRYHDILVEKEGNLQGVVCSNEIMKVKPEKRSQLQLQQLPIKNVSTFLDGSVLEAYKTMSREKIDTIPVVDKDSPLKVIGVLTAENIVHAYEKAKNLR
jgi:Zn-dependent protease